MKSIQDKTDIKLTPVEKDFLKSFSDEDAQRELKGTIVGAVITGAIALGYAYNKGYFDSIIQYFQ